MAEENEHQLFDITESPSQADRDLAAMLFAETAPPPSPVGEETLAPPAPPAAPEKPGFLSRLKGMFRRSAPPDALAPEEDAREAEEAAKPGLLTRLFRRASAEERSAVEETGEEAVAPETTEEETSTEEATETRPSPYKKILLVSLLLLAVLGIGVGSAVFTFKRLQASKEAEYRQQTEVLARQQEALKKQQEEMAALKAQNDKLSQEAEAAKAVPPAPTPETAQAKPTPEAGDVDCAVVGKENAAETIKRCIEAYNRATGRAK
jgi:hypothetical protein